MEDIFIICGADQLVRKRSKIELINKLWNAEKQQAGISTPQTKVSQEIHFFQLISLSANEKPDVLCPGREFPAIKTAYGQKHFFATDCSVLLYHYVCDFILFLNQSKVGLYKCTSECSVIRCKGKNKKSIVILVRKSEVNTYHCLLWKPQNCRIQRWCIHLVWIMCITAKGEFD